MEHPEFYELLKKVTSLNAMCGLLLDSEFNEIFTEEERSKLFEICSFIDAHFGLEKQDEVFYDITKTLYKEIIQEWDQVRCSRSFAISATR